MDLPKPHPEYCPSCGKQLGNTVEEGRQRLYCSSCQKVVWMNPEMVAGVAVIKDNELLLIKRGIEPNKGSLSFPAGYLEIDEKPIEAASRELEEETGIKTNLEDLEFFNHIKIYNELGGHVILSLYTIDWKYVSGVIKTGDEVKDSKFWNKAKIEERKEDLEYEKFIEHTRKLLEKRGS